MSLNQLDRRIAAMPDMQAKPNRSNLRTGLILASVALLFFLGVIAKRVFLG